MGSGREKGEILLAADPACRQLPFLTSSKSESLEQATEKKMSFSILSLTEGIIFVLWPLVYTLNEKVL